MTETRVLSHFTVFVSILNLPYRSIFLPFHFSTRNIFHVFHFQPVKFSIPLVSSKSLKCSIIELKDPPLLYFNWFHYRRSQNYTPNFPDFARYFLHTFAPLFQFHSHFHFIETNFTLLGFLFHSQN